MANFFGDALGAIGGGANTVDDPNYQLYVYGGDQNYAQHQRNRFWQDANRIDARAGQDADPALALAQAGEQYQNAGLARAQTQALLGQQQGVIGQSQALLGQGQNLYGQQQGLANQYQGVINGTAGPSLAELQMRAGLQQSNQNALNMVANAGANNAGLGLRSALMAQQQNALGAAQQGGMLRAQETEAARQGLGQAYGAMGNQLGSMQTQVGAIGGQLGAMQNQVGNVRGQDLSGLQLAYGRAGQQNQNFFTQQAANDARYQNAIQNELALNQGQGQANQAYATSLANTQQYNAAAQGKAQEAGSNLLGSVAKGALGLFTGGLL